MSCNHDELRRDMHAVVMQCDYAGLQQDVDGYPPLALWTCLVCRSTLAIPTGPEPAIEVVPATPPALQSLRDRVCAVLEQHGYSTAPVSEFERFAAHVANGGDPAKYHERAKA